MEALLLLLISILPVYLIGRYVYRKDSSIEPKNLIIKLFCGGIGALVMTIVISLFLGIFFPIILSDEFDMDMFTLFIRVFFGVALIEEFSKWIFLYKIAYNSDEFDQVYDMIVYSVFVALGFACVENILYVFENGFGIGIIRAISAVPGHASFGVFMGYFLAMAKVSDVKGDSISKKNNIMFSILFSVLLHGFYDYCLFSGNFIFIGLLCIFIICLYIFVIGKIRNLSKVTGKFRYKNNYCGYCGRPVDSDYCPNCGGKNE